MNKLRNTISTNIKKTEPLFAFIKLIRKKEKKTDTNKKYALSES